MREGLYKVEFHTVHGTGTGVVYATAGKLRGGNSAFAFVGNYVDRDEGIQVKVSTQRHNADPAFRPLFGTDMITLTLRGIEHGDMVDFEGTALQVGGRLQGDPDPDQRLSRAGTSSRRAQDGSFGSFSTKPLKQVSRSSSSLKPPHSVTDFVGAFAFGLGLGAITAS